ncbi:MAG: GIY-YIG nuclease family protein [Woeseiaceae bacterium]
MTEKQKSDWFVYILECNDKTLYTGITNNLEKRIEQHNSSTDGAKYTRPRRPVKYVYQEKQLNRSEATKREMAIKKLSRLNKLQLIKSI